MQTRKTSTITFRIEDNIVDKLKTESHNRQVSTNTLVNQALKRFLEWDMYAPRVGFVSLCKPVFINLFKKMDEKEVTEIVSTVGKDEISDIALFMKGKIDITSFMEWFEMRMVNSSVQVSHTKEDGLHTYVMKHDLGKNWSLYNKTTIEQIFREMFCKVIDVTYDEGMFCFQFNENRS